MTRSIEYDISMGKIWRHWESLERKKALEKWLSWRCVNMYEGCWCRNKHMSWLRAITNASFDFMFYFELYMDGIIQGYQKRVVDVTHN